MTKRPQAKAPTKAQVKAAADRAAKRGDETREKNNPKGATRTLTAAEKRQASQGTDEKTVEVIKRTSSDTLVDLMEKVETRAGKMQTMAGETGKMVADAVEHKFLHRKAWAHTKMLKKMAQEPEKLAEFFYHLDHYMEVFEFRKTAAKALRFDMGDGGPNTGAGDQEEHEDDGQEQAQAAASVDQNTQSNVTRPRFPGAVNTKTGQPAAEGHRAAGP